MNFYPWSLDLDPLKEKSSQYDVFRDRRRKRSRSRDQGLRGGDRERDREREKEREEEKKRAKEEEARNKDREEDRKKKGLPTVLHCSCGRRTGVNILFIRCVMAT